MGGFDTPMAGGTGLRLDGKRKSHIHYVTSYFKNGGLELASWIGYYVGTLGGK
jgi:hypothetical protein